MNTEQLTTWMQSNGHTNCSLAMAMGYSYEYIYKLTTGERPVTEGFRWRFARTFGWEEVQRVFGDAESEPIPTA